MAYNRSERVFVFEFFAKLSPAKAYIRRTESLSKAFFFCLRGIIRGWGGGLKRLRERLRACG